ncbi:MAG: hypothetical protein M9894_22435 [Planctomycetes bacterium]|nr:hypothetical protein [Planctomycetota bacterium]
MKRPTVPIWVLLALIVVLGSGSVVWFEWGRYYVLARSLVPHLGAQPQLWYMHPHAALETQTTTSEPANVVAELRRDRSRADKLIGLLIESSDPVWRSAAWRLLRAGAGSLSPHLERVERGPDEPDATVREDMFRAVGIAAFNESWERVTQQVPPDLNWVADQLTWGLADPAPCVREIALITYGTGLRRRAPGIAEQIESNVDALLEDPEPELRSSALMFLVQSTRGQLEPGRLARNRDRARRAIRAGLTPEIEQRLLSLGQAVNADVLLLLAESGTNPKVVRIARDAIIDLLVAWKIIERYVPDEEALPTIRAHVDRYLEEGRRRGFIAPASELQDIRELLPKK